MYIYKYGKSSGQDPRRASSLKAVFSPGEQTWRPDIWETEEDKK